MRMMDENAAADLDTGDFVFGGADIALAAMLIKLGSNRIRSHRP